LSSGETSLSFELVPPDNDRLASLCGPHDEHLLQLERSLGVQILRRGHHFDVSGSRIWTGVANRVLETAYGDPAREPITRASIHLLAQTLKTAH